MKILSRKKLASTAYERWNKTYGDGRYGEDKLVILKKLKKLGNDPDPNDVDIIIGNNTWTSLQCSECDGFKETMIIVRYDNSQSCYLCKDCVSKAFKLIKKGE